ncbi:acyltransferase [Dyella solisilvae]|uniref:Acyltransferase n=2 Tax=Dyella solisilvae TaxID=1920168 RepID=A0A370KBY2_9GAMM|nr:acyltransferase [Dyella solisilvae]
MAALMVLSGHQYALMFLLEPRPFGLVTMGTLGVLVFFVLSGYLVAQSWRRDPHPWRFAVRRFLRIWPGLGVVVVLTTFVVGPVFTEESLGAYFQDAQTWKYLEQLGLIQQPDLPGVFHGNVWSVVNGSLWTIPLEVRWYAILMVAGACGLLSARLRVPLLTVVVAYAFYMFVVFDVQRNPAAAYPKPGFGCEYGCFFCYGVVLFHWQSAWARRPLLLAACLGAMASVAAVLNYSYLALYLVLPFVVIWFGNRSTPWLSRAGRYGDLSYGIYIYAYLVQQSIIAVIGFRHGYALTLLISLLATLACAYASWHLVEKPALGLKHHLTAAGSADVTEGTSVSSATP